MGTMNISLPDTLKAFVDEQVAQRGYGTSSEYVRELIRRDQDRVQLKELLLAGASVCAWLACRCLLLRGTPCPGSQTQARRSGVRAKPVIPRESAIRDVDEAIEYYVNEAAADAPSASSTPWSKPVTTSVAILQRARRAMPRS